MALHISNNFRLHLRQGKCYILQIHLIWQADITAMFKPQFLLHLQLTVFLNIASVLKVFVMQF